MGLLEVTFFINIECGSFDSMLLVYDLRNGAWKKELRWQAAPLHQVSDAYGDFFLSAVLLGSSATGGAEWRVIVAHGTPWCTSGSAPSRWTCWPRVPIRMRRESCGM